MIIPRSPSPPPLEERPIDSLTMEEMKELLVRQRVSSHDILKCRLLILCIGAYE